MSLPVLTTASRARLALGLVLALFALSVPLARGAAATQNFDFSGHVYANGSPQWIVHTMDVSAPGQLTATLDWATSSANLNMFLLDANGKTQKFAASASRPESLTFDLPDAGRWKIRVSANSGDSQYSLHVDIGADAAEPPPDEPPGVSGEGTQSLSFDGHVYAAGKPQWIIHKMNVTKAGKLTATLNWGAASANLNMFLLDANGKTKASASGSNRPEKITFTLPSAGLWKIRVSAKSGHSAYTLAVDIGSGNSAPNAVNDTATTEANTAINVWPLDNDTDANGDTLTIGNVGTPGNGIANKIDTTSINYTPNADSTGTDFFTYEACDNAATPLCGTATVTVNIIVPRTTNATPVANNDSAATNTNSNVVVSVLSNDTDADGDQMTPVIDAAPAHGIATVNANGTITYAAGGPAGTDSFTYHVCDNWTTSACSAAAMVSVAVSEAPTGGSGLLLHAPEFMTTRHTLTLEQALQQARDFHVIASGDVSLYKKYIPQMKEAAQQAGHSLTMLQYINGTFILKNEVPSYTDESMYMHTKDNKRIQSKDFGNTLSNIFNPAWIETRINTCNTRMSQAGGADGCFLDTMGLAPVNPTYVTPGVPYNHAKDAAYTAKEWLDGTTNIAQQVKAGLGGKKLWVNGLLNGSYYSSGTAPTKQLLDASDGGMIEILFRPPNTAVTAYPNETKWKADVDMLAAAAARSNKPLITTTKVWVPGTQQQYDSWHRYSLASFLMGTTGHEYFNFRLDKNMTTKDVFADTPIGTPTAGYGKVGAYYRRNFTNGIVVVNPTKNAVTVTLDRQYRTLQGQVVSGTITMAPNTGDVLVNA